MYRAADYYNVGRSAIYLSTPPSVAVNTDVDADCDCVVYPDVESVFFTGEVAAATLSSTLNTSLGFGSGKKILGGSAGHSNTLVGAHTGENVSSGFDNAVMGVDAGRALTKGYYNVLIGSKSGRGLTEGDNNIFVGVGNGELAVTARANTLLGGGVGNKLRDVYGNTSVGYYSCYALETGQMNTVMGTMAAFELPCVCVYTFGAHNTQTYH